MYGIIKLFSKYKKNKLIIYISAIFCCLFVVVGINMLIPNVEAAYGDGDSIMYPIVVEPGNITVEEGKYYSIMGTKSLSSSYIFEYTGEASEGSVNIVLDATNITLTTDIPAIEFKSAEGITFNVMILGKSNIKGINGALEPLIKAENYSIPIYTSSTDEGNEVERIEYIKNNVKINFEEVNEGGSHLYLKTGIDSYGAAIGTSEIQHMIDSKTSNLTEEDDEQFIYTKDKITLGSAPITITSGMIDIVGNGYGSGIGNGGHKSNDLQLKTADGDISVPATVAKAEVYIKNGTISVIMSQNSKGACFGKGAVYGGVAASDGLVIIDGGSLYLSRQGQDAIQREYMNIKNSKGERVSLYTADYSKESGFNTYRYGLNNRFECETEYIYSVRQISYNPGNGDIMALIVKVDLEDGQYMFNGDAHNNAQNGTLYFYLPSAGLVNYEFNISYDFGLLASDENEASKIVNTNPLTEDYGEEVMLIAPTWDDKHHFKGWYSKDTDQMVTKITSTTQNETIEVYAKWECYVSYKDNENTIETPYIVDYGSYITNEQNKTLPANTELIEYIGWNIDGTVYAQEETFSYQVTQDLIIAAESKIIGCYIYLDAVYTDKSGNEKQCDIARYASFHMVYEDKKGVDFGDIDDALYYKAIGFINGDKQATAIITPDEGYVISEKVIKDASGNTVNFTVSDEDIYANLLTISQVDIYITIYFKAQTYSITYYDINEEGALIKIPVDYVTNNNVESFMVESESIKLNKLNTRDNYWNFKGWYEWGTSTSNIITIIEPKDYKRNLVLVASWEEVPTTTIDDKEDESTTVYIENVKETDATKGTEKTKLVEAILNETTDNGVYETIEMLATGDSSGNNVGHLAFICIIVSMITFLLIKKSSDLKIK